MKNYRGFKVTYLGATNTKGSRVKINDLRHNKSKTISYDYSKNDISSMAEDYLSKLGIELWGKVCHDSYDILFTDNFDIMI